MGSRLHRDEVPVDARRVHRLVAAQLPNLAELPLRPVPNPGTDNVIYRLGPELAVRLPRHASAVPALLREMRWLPTVAGALPLPVPTPVEAGAPGPGYPFPWLVYRWVPGTPTPPADLATGDARRLAEFVHALHSLDPGDGPRIEPGERAGPVAAYQQRARSALEAVRRLQTTGRVPPGTVDLARAERVWAAAVAAPPWSGPGVWVHRDLYFGNLLSIAGRLAGVIDFGGLAVGDPAGDALGAFHMLAPPDRVTFGEIVGIDEPAWARARGWALVQGLEALPYYLDTHPDMVTMARRAIAAATGP